MSSFINEHGKYFNSRIQVFVKMFRQLGRKNSHSRMMKQSPTRKRQKSVERSYPKTWLNWLNRPSFIDHFSRTHEYTRLTVAESLNKTDVTRAILSRDFIAATLSRDKLADAASVELHTATLSRKQTRLLHQFSRFTIFLHKHRSKLMKIFHISPFVNCCIDRTLSFC